MVTNIILTLGIILGFTYLLYDQIIMNKLKGKNILAIPLQRQAKGDSYILIGLIALTIIHGVQSGIEAITIYLLSGCILLAVFTSFMRYPRLLLKEHGFFFGNIYFRYENIHEVNLADNQILVIDLKEGRRLLVRIRDKEDIEKVINFFGGYK